MEIYIAPLQGYNSEVLLTLARLKRRVSLVYYYVFSICNKFYEERESYEERGIHSLGQCIGGLQFVFHRLCWLF